MLETFFTYYAVGGMVTSTLCMILNFVMYMRGDVKEDELWTMMDYLLVVLFWPPALILGIVSTIFLIIIWLAERK